MIMDEEEIWGGKVTHNKFIFPVSRDKPWPLILVSNT